MLTTPWSGSRAHPAAAEQAIEAVLFVENLADVRVLRIRSVFGEKVHCEPREVSTLLHRGDPAIDFLGRDVFDMRGEIP